MDTAYPESRGERYHVIPPIGSPRLLRGGAWVELAVPTASRYRAATAASGRSRAHRKPTCANDDSGVAWLRALTR